MSGKKCDRNASDCEKRRWSNNCSAIYFAVHDLSKKKGCGLSGSQIESPLTFIGESVSLIVWFASILRSVPHHLMNVQHNETQGVRNNEQGERANAQLSMLNSQLSTSKSHRVINAQDKRTSAAEAGTDFATGWSRVSRDEEMGGKF